jgi:hypothetical protein
MMARTQRGAAVAIGLALALFLSVTAGATTHAKPADELVAKSLKVLTWQYPVVLRGKVTHRSLVITSAVLVPEVRTMINGLPLTIADPHRICPTDYVLPFTLSFSVSRDSPAVTRVVVEFGGCPYAQVYQNGVKITPTLGGSSLILNFAKVEKLLRLQGLPLELARG